jgi:hypothetical protein
MATPSKNAVQTAIDQYIDSLAEPLRMLNQKVNFQLCKNGFLPYTKSQIHGTPELAYEEHVAHDAICDFLQSQGIYTTRHAYGLSTAFEAKVGNGDGRSVNFNAEYDALPGIGPACGHNLIAISSITGFLALFSPFTNLVFLAIPSFWEPRLKKTAAGRLILFARGRTRKRMCL